MTPDALSELILRDTPLIDVRAPVEFEGGAFPASVNLPIMNDAERHRIGKRYKDEGHDAAVGLGHDLVSGPLRAARIESWQAVLRRHPNAQLYCFRGGQRSNIAASWLREAGTPVPVIEGGYKRLRRHMLELADALPGMFSYTIVGGQTGTGKTLLLRELPDFSIDLEQYANHRGSAYGALPTGQPAQINFEHECIANLLRLREQGRRHIAVEDESHRVGRVTVPPVLFAAMSEAPVAVIEEPHAARVERIYDEYVTVQHGLFVAIYGPHAGFIAYAEYLRRALTAIRKRLGGVLHAELSGVLEGALHRHAAGDPADHRAWISRLLHGYYDRMYAYQLERKTDRVMFRGSYGAVREYLTEACG